MKSFRMFMTVVGILALSLTGFAQARMYPRQGTMAPGAGMMGVDLNLTPDQTAKLEAHRKAAAEEMTAFTEQMTKLRQEMWDLRKDGQPDLAKLNPLIDKMTKLSADRQKAVAKHQVERNKIFTPEQLEILKSRAGRLGRFGMATGSGLTGGAGMLMGGRMGLAMRPGMMTGRMGMMRPGRGMMAPARGRLNWRQPGAGWGRGFGWRWEE